MRTISFRFSAGRLAALCALRALAAAPATTAWHDGNFHIDAAGVLHRSDNFLGRPNSAASEAMPLGNGRLGVAVWSADGLTAQLNRADTLPDRLSSGQVVIPGLLRWCELRTIRGGSICTTARCASRAAAWRRRCTCSRRAILWSAMCGARIRTNRRPHSCAYGRRARSMPRWTARWGCCRNTGQITRGPELPGGTSDRWPALPQRTGMYQQRLRNRSGKIRPGERIACFGCEEAGAGAIGLAAL